MVQVIAEINQFAGCSRNLFLLELEPLYGDLNARSDCGGAFQHDAKLVHFGQQALNGLWIRRRGLRPGSNTRAQDKGHSSHRSECNAALS